jgi:hypothetical protein
MRHEVQSIGTGLNRLIIALEKESCSLPLHGECPLFVKALNVLHGRLFSGQRKVSRNGRASASGQSAWCQAEGVDESNRNRLQVRAAFWD